jgi:hypothetical protein
MSDPTFRSSAASTSLTHSAPTLAATVHDQVDGLTRDGRAEALTSDPVSASWQVKRRRDSA